jgi:hypothetical protein
MLQRPEWPHTINDIVKALDGIWGIVGAISTEGNLLRLERSLHEPTTYTLTEYNLQDEASVRQTKHYTAEQKPFAVGEFARLLGFSQQLTATAESDR